MDVSRRQLAFPRGLNQSFVVLEVLRGCVIGLIRHAGRPPLAVGQVFRLELFDPREDSFRGRPDRPAAHVPVKDLRKSAGLGGQDGSTPGEGFERDKRCALLLPSIWYEDAPLGAFEALAW